MGSAGLEPQGPPTWKPSPLVSEGQNVLEGSRCREDNVRTTVKATHRLVLWVGEAGLSLQRGRSYMSFPIEALWFSNQILNAGWESHFERP